MMTLIKGFPDNVVGVSGKGRVTAEDYRQVLVPAVEKALAKQKKVRFYYELGTEFLGMEMGAMWEDFAVGVGHWSSWERFAVVTDNEWIRHAVQFFSFMMPCKIKIFSNNEAAAAKEWITA